jgi:hypothetical protein
VQLDQLLARGDEISHVLDQVGKYLSPPGDVAPKVIAPEATTAIFESLRRIAQLPVVFVEHIVGAEQPMIVEREYQRYIQPPASDKGGQRGTRNVVDVHQVGLDALYFVRYSPIRAEVKDLQKGVVRSVGWVGHIVDRNVSEFIMPVPCFWYTGIDRQHRGIYAAFDEAVAGVISCNFCPTYVVGWKIVCDYKSAHQFS